MQNRVPFCLEPLPLCFWSRGAVCVLPGAMSKSVPAPAPKAKALRAGSGGLCVGHPEKSFGLFSRGRTRTGPMGLGSEAFRETRPDIWELKGFGLFKGLFGCL